MENTTVRICIEQSVSPMSTVTSKNYKSRNAQHRTCVHSLKITSLVWLQHGFPWRNSKQLSHYSTDLRYGTEHQQRPNVTLCCYAYVPLFLGIVSVEAKLAYCLAKHPTFVPLPAQFEIDHNPSVHPGNKKGASGGNNASKRKKGASDAPDDDFTSQDVAVTKKKSKKGVSKKKPDDEKASEDGAEGDVLDLVSGWLPFVFP